MEKLVTGILALLVIAIGIGVVMTLMPVFLFIAGFFLMIGAIKLIARIIVG